MAHDWPKHTRDIPSGRGRVGGVHLLQRRLPRLLRDAELTAQGRGQRQRGGGGVVALQATAVLRLL